MQLLEFILTISSGYLEVLSKLAGMTDQHEVSTYSPKTNTFYVKTMITHTMFSTTKIN